MSYENKIILRQTAFPATISLICFVLFLVFVIVPNATARVSNSGNETVVQEEAIESQFAQMSFPNLQVATSGVLVDVSDTRDFQHFASGTPEISQLVFGCDSKTAGTSTIDVGVLTGINAAN